MSRELPTLRGTVTKVKKGKGINYGFVFSPVAINGYQGPMLRVVFVGEHMLGGKKLVEGMSIQFDAQLSTFRAHRDKYEALNVSEVRTVAQTT